MTDAPPEPIVEGSVRAGWQPGLGRASDRRWPTVGQGIRRVVAFTCRASAPLFTMVRMENPRNLLNDARGRVVTPEDPSFDAAIQIVYPGFGLTPAAVVYAADAADVATVVRAAVASGTELAVRGGGHSPAGFALTHGGIVLDMSGLKDLEIDEDAQTAWAGAGLTASEYTGAVGERGFATPFGDTGSVGIAGITLAGGAGFLARSHGLAIDSLLAVQMVTAQGDLITVDSPSDPDLFWALRGGGGNFGVVTRLKFRLHPLPGVVGGMIALPASAEAIAGFAAASVAAPPSVSTIASAMTAPPAPFIPPELVGSMVLFAFVCYSGADDGAEGALAPFRALGAPLLDTIAPIPYAGMFPPEPGGEGGEGEGAHAPEGTYQTLFTDRIDADDAAAILEALESSRASFRVVQFRALGGAVAAVPNDATAYAHRDRAFMVNVFASHDDPGEVADRAAWVRELADAIRHGERGAYTGFLGDEGPERLREAYPPATWKRLAAVKARLDPDNVFHRSHNVEPARP
jgi:FAD/FMN-containing dehydrogenase